MGSNDLDIFQQMYLHIFGADLAGKFVGTEAHLQKALDNALEKLMSDQLKNWEVVWGPRVYKKKPESMISGLDNAWFASCAKNLKYPDGTIKDTYVIAIAGTAVFSGDDWITEDFSVKTVVDFDAWSKSWDSPGILPPQGVQNPPKTGTYTAYGASDGVFQLLSNPSPSEHPGQGTTIVEFLQGLPKNCRVVFGGHSLGGALSPTITLGLLSSGVLKQIGDPVNNVLVLPAAGATPGEGNFQQAFQKLLPSKGGQGYQVWNADLFNTLDIVPMAWCTDPALGKDRYLDRIQTIYGQLPGRLGDQVRNLINKEKDSANSSGVVYIPLPGNAFTGDPPAQPPSNWLAFIEEVAKQHSKAYLNKISIQPTLSKFYQEMAAMDGVEKQNATYVAKSFPVLRYASNEMLGDDRDTTYPYDVILKE